MPCPRREELRENKQKQGRRGVSRSGAGGDGSGRFQVPSLSPVPGQPLVHSVPQQEDHLAVITPIKKTNGWNLKHIK